MIVVLSVALGLAVLVAVGLRYFLIPLLRLEVIALYDRRRRRARCTSDIEDRLRQELDEAVARVWMLEHERDLAVDRLTHKLGEAKGETVMMRARWLVADEERQRAQAEADRYARQLTSRGIALARSDDERPKVRA